MKKNTTLLIIVGIVCAFLGTGVGYSISMMQNNMSTSHMTHDTMKHDMMSHESMGHNMVSHDPMQMTMEDMGKMLEGKQGDELNKAFLEGMIPHHQGAIDMARTLIKSDKPELQKMGEEIIAAQQAEIDQMNEWLIEWGYID